MRAVGRVAVVACLLAAVAGCASRRDPGDPLLEPHPSREVLRRLALDHRGLPADLQGEIPPADRWIGVRRDPPSGLERTRTGLNIRVNQDTSGFDQNETVLSVNPLDPLNLTGGANDYRTGSVKCGYYASLDGGETWTDGVLPEGTYPFQGDPTVAHCADGSVAYVCLSFSGAFQPHGLFFYRSTDGGRNWTAPRALLDRPSGFPFADKEWVQCDRTPSSPYANRIYVTWTDFGLNGSPILLRRSNDAGTTWSSNVRVSDGTSCQGSVIAVGADGAVNVAWDNGADIGFDRSTDGGQTFGVDRIPSTVVDIPADPVFRRNSFPVMDVDRSGGPHHGTIYIAWSDNRNGDPDILLVRSEDDGQTWSEPIRVNDDPLGNGADQFFPWLTVDPEGRVIVTFFDRRRFAGLRPYEIWGAVSRDGGGEFDTNFLISDTASDGSLNGFVGDYSGLAATSDYLYAFWTDLRAGTGETDAYTDRYPNTFAYDEVRGLAWSDRDSLGFEEQDARFGVDLDYDVASGTLSELRADGGFDRAACAAAAWGASPYVDARVPPADDGYWFLIRAAGPEGKGTYGDASPARPNVRDPLDDSIPACP